MKINTKFILDAVEPSLKSVEHLRKVGDSIRSSADLFRSIDKSTLAQMEGMQKLLLNILPELPAINRIVENDLLSIQKIMDQIIPSEILSQTQTMINALNKTITEQVAAVQAIQDQMMDSGLLQVIEATKSLAALPVIAPELPELKYQPELPCAIDFQRFKPLQLPKIEMPAESSYKQIRNEIDVVLSSLKEDERLTVYHDTPAGERIIVYEIGYKNPNLIVLISVDEEGNTQTILAPVESIHLQLKITKMVEQKPKRSIGFLGDW